MCLEFEVFDWCFLFDVLLSPLFHTLLFSLFRHIQAYCVWASLRLGACMYGCPSLFEGMHTSGSTAHLYLSIDFELNFWSMKRTLCSTSVSLSPSLWTVNFSSCQQAQKVYWIKYQCFYLLLTNLCSSHVCRYVCVQVCVCMCYSDELGKGGWLNRVVMLIQWADCIIQCSREMDWTWPC